MVKRDQFQHLANGEKHQVRGHQHMRVADLDHEKRVAQLNSYREHDKPEDPLARGLACRGYLFDQVAYQWEDQ